MSEPTIRTLMLAADQEATRGRFDIKQSVAALADYWSTYGEQAGYEDYTLKTFLEDAIYGIGISLSDHYRGASGHDAFKRDLSTYLAEADQ